MKRVFKGIYLAVKILIIALTVQSCKDGPEMGINPYEGGRPPLGVFFENLNRKLDMVRPGEVFQVTVKGLKQYEDILQVYINEQEADVVAVSDSTLDIRVPALVSSGGIKIMIRDQVYYGPRVPIEGKVMLDTDFDVANGFNGAVSEIIQHGVNYLVVGSFTDYENQASTSIFRNNIHSITSAGASVTDQNLFLPLKGGLGGINSIARLSDGNLIVGGSFYSYNGRAVTGITRLTSRASLDTMIVDVINTTPENPFNSLDTVPAFNASMIGYVARVFPANDLGVIIVGNFTNHLRADYMYSSRAQRHYYNTRVRGIAKLKSNGTLDSTFMYNNVGPNGNITGSIQLPDGRVVIVGSFTTFNGSTANRVICINPDGTIDNTFNVGSGANNAIFNITYNPAQNKIALAGRFTAFNGVPTNGVVILDGSGAVNTTFVLRDIGDGIPNYAKVLNSGKVLVMGNFKEYEGINRSNLLILEPDGTAQQEYNNVGGFSGMISSVVETTSSMGYPALLIGGAISTADDTRVGNIFRLEVKN